MESNVKDNESDTIPSFHELESLNLFSQGNIYTTKIVRQQKCSSSQNQTDTKGLSILVGTLKPPKLLNIEFQNDQQNANLESVSEKEIFSCKYLQLETPSEVNTELIAFEVVEFEALNKTNEQKMSSEGKKNPDSSFNICATSVKLEFSDDDQCEKEFYLKIYDGYDNLQSPSGCDNTKYVTNIELECLETFQLEFVPYCLTYCDVPSSDENRENILLLSGSDDLIHGYRKDDSSKNVDAITDLENHEKADNKINSYRKEAKSNFNEIDDDEMMHLFPEFSTPTPSPALSLSFSYPKNELVSCRWTAIGCQDGQLQIFQVDPIKGEVLKVFEDLEFAGIGGIHHARFFKLPVNNENDNSIFNLIVVPSLERSALYVDIDSSKKLLHLDKETQMLEHSSDFDSVNGCAIFDIDGDGYPEIVLGTYGQELIIYKMYKDKNPNDEHATKTSCDPSPKWKIWMRKSFSYPILAVEGWTKYDDNADLVNSILAVTTIKTIHILQYDKRYTS